VIQKITTGRPKTQCRRSQLVAEHELVSTRDPAHFPVVIRKITTKTNTPTATAMTGPNCKASCEGWPRAVLTMTSGVAQGRQSAPGRQDHSRHLTVYSTASEDRRHTSGHPTRPPSCAALAPLFEEQGATQAPTQKPVGSGVGFEVAGAGSDKSRTVAADTYRRKYPTKTNTPTATAMNGPNCKASWEGWPRAVLTMTSGVARGRQSAPGRHEPFKAFDCLVNRL
jgi:hypothetical protein